MLQAAPQFGKYGRHSVALGETGRAALRRTQESGMGIIGSLAATHQALELTLRRLQLLLRVAAIQHLIDRLEDDR